MRARRRERHFILMNKIKILNTPLRIIRSSGGLVKALLVKFI